ncbi:glycoside hydrolase family 76 protein [Sulfobacillus thermotolerans]|uniref:glycoside hydrolase family 76 protein n=1 Tax=Sulfobacillus thermotolerans TaxID=338644 RepID=UPI0033668849
MAPASPEWRDFDAVVCAWERLWAEYKVGRWSGFKESTEVGHHPFWAYNWSFGALLSACGKLTWLPDGRTLVEEVEGDLLASVRTYESGDGLMDSIPHQSDEFPGGIYFDDNAWIGLAALDLYEGLRHKPWLEIAQGLYQGIVSRGLDVGSGGILWRQIPPRTVHVCSTGPTLLLGLRLWRLAQGDGRGIDPKMLAMEQWVRSMQRADGLFNDHVDLVSGRAATAFDVSAFVQPFMLAIEESWDAFLHTRECLSLACLRDEPITRLLRDKAAALETLVLLHHYAYA